MASFEVNTELVKNSAANTLKELADNYKAQYGQLYTEVEALRGDNWKGTASDTFNARIGEYQSDFEALYNTLAEIKDALDLIAGNYESQENKVQEAASRL